MVSSVLLSSLELSDTKVYEPQTRALLGTASHFCEVVVLKLRTAWCADVQQPPGGLEQGVDAAGSKRVSSSSLLLSSLELSDTQVYEP